MTLPDYAIHVCSNDDGPPAEAEQLFKEELADSRRDKPNADKWRFVNICALSGSDKVLGGLHMDVGPIEFGPLADERLAYLEHLFVRPEYRNHGIATVLLNRATDEALSRGCNHIRFNVSWNNPAAIAVCRKSGFALTCLEDGGYFVMKPTSQSRAVPDHGYGLRLVMKNPKPMMCHAEGFL